MHALGPHLLAFVFRILGDRAHALAFSSRWVVWIALAAVSTLSANAASIADGGNSGRLEPLREYSAASQQKVDHTFWQGFLDAYARNMRGEVVVSYGSIPKQIRKQLRGYIQSLAETPWAQLGRDEQLAAWINLYNALSVEIVLEYWPLRESSILRSPPRNERGPYSEPRIEVRGVALSAEDILHGVLREGWGDPRILYTLHGAALGGPRLAAQAFVGATIGTQLDNAARRFVNAPRGVATSLGKLNVSRIYEWFAGDFGGSDGKILEHLRSYADERVTRSLLGKTKIHGYRYDWKLDEHSQRRPGDGDGLYGS